MNTRITINHPQRGQLISVAETDDAGEAIRTAVAHHFHAGCSTSATGIAETARTRYLSILAPSYGAGERDHWSIDSRCRVDIERTADAPMNDAATAQPIGEIYVPFDLPDAAEFVAWLRGKGHDAHVGRDDAGRVAGLDEPEDARRFIATLWDRFCAE